MAPRRFIARVRRRLALWWPKQAFLPLAHCRCAGLVAASIPCQWTTFEIVSGRDHHVLAALESALWITRESERDKMPLQRPDVYAGWQSIRKYARWWHVHGQIAGEDQQVVCVALQAAIEKGMCV